MDTTTTFTPALPYREGDTIRMETGQGPAKFYKVAGGSLEPAGNRHQRRSEWAKVRKATRVRT